LGVDKYRVGLQGNEFSFGKMKDIQGKFLWGPMSAHDFRSYFVGQLASVQQHKEIKQVAIQKLEEGLNRSVLDRILLFAGYVGLGTFLFGIPAAWLSCHAMVWIRKRLRYRSRRIGLA
jgi:hypothetical protein